MKKIIEWLVSVAQLVEQLNNDPEFKLGKFGKGFVSLDYAGLDKVRSVWLCRLT